MGKTCSFLPLSLCVNEQVATISIMSVVYVASLIVSTANAIWLELIKSSNILFRL